MQSLQTSYCDPSVRTMAIDWLAFEGLSPATRTRFQPHPLTREQAVALCGSPATEGTAMRLVLEHDGSVIAYFILEHQGDYQTDVWNHDMRLVLNG